MCNAFDHMYVPIFYIFDNVNVPILDVFVQDCVYRNNKYIYKCFIPILNVFDTINVPIYYIFDHVLEMTTDMFRLS